MTLPASEETVVPATDAEIEYWEPHYSREHLVTSLIARIRSEREQAVRECAENVWRPIETAPRDGTPILAFNSRHMSHAPVVVEWKEVELDPDLGPEPHWADAATASGTALYYNGLYFDYWMPTPAFTSLSQVRAKK